MKFVLVNGRTPYPQTFCMLRCESIKSGYLRATTTQYPYYDYECTRSTANPWRGCARISREKNQE